MTGLGTASGKIISDETIDAAARELATLRSVMGEFAWRDCRSDARSILLAAAPLIEAAIRDKVADEILAAAKQMSYRAVNGKTYRSPTFDSLAAARVARGGSR